MTKASKTITVRFAMTKGEGDYPEARECSKKERKDPSTFTMFFLAWDDEFAASKRLTRETVEECVVIYNGISPTSDNESGLYFDDEELCGYPSPIIEFRLTKAVNPDTFLKCIWMSSVMAQPVSRIESGIEPFVFEDHNGYIRVLSQSEIESTSNNLKDEGLYLEKVYYLEELEAGVVCSSMTQQTLKREPKQKANS
jgi:hypothetical protein